MQPLSIVGGLVATGDGCSRERARESERERSYIAERTDKKGIKIGDSACLTY